MKIRIGTVEYHWLMITTPDGGILRIMSINVRFSNAYAASFD
jgi:hypothetical protein